MENRFGVKDFFLFLIIGVLIVLVVLTMFQYDRQWSLEEQTNSQLNDLSGEVATIHRMLVQGGTQIQSSSASSQALVGFERILRSQAQPDYAEGDDLVQTTDATVNSLTPLICDDIYGQVMQYYLFDQLVELDPQTFQWLPRLAISWQISPDMKTVDFWLRRGATFSNGDPLTADDIVWTFDWVMNQQVQAPRERSYLSSLIKAPGSDHYCEKVDDYHIRFRFSESYFMSFDAVAYCPIYILDRNFYGKYSPADFNTSTGLVLGSGPYRLADPTSWRPAPGKPIVLVRNERYWGPRPSFNKIIWKVIEDPTARATSFTNGDTDFWGPGFFGPHPEQYDHIMSDPATASRIQHFDLQSPLTGFNFIAWGEKQGRDGPPTPFADPRVRRAMTMLIDRWAIVKNLIKGYGTVVSGPFSPLTDQSDPTIKPWPFDPSAAQKLLADAGYIKRGDQLFGPDGKPFTFKFLYTPVSDVARRIVPIVHDSLAQAGILVIPEPQEWTAMLKRIDDRQFDAVTMGWSGQLPSDDPYQIFHSSQAAGTGDDFTQFANKDLDDAIVEARRTLDHDKRTELWHKVHQILHDQEPYTFLYAEHELSLADPRIHGIEPTREGLLYRITEWYVPKALQKYND